MNNEKKVLQFLRTHKEDVERVVDVCESYKIPYLTPSYKCVLGVIDDMIKEIEKVDKK